MSSESKPASATPASDTERAELVADPLSKRHLKIGWYSILGFASLGVALEGMLWFDTGFYLQVGGEMTRLLWRLAHVHGTLLGVIHIAFGLSVYIARGWDVSSRKYGSMCLVAAGILLPVGFFLGGISAWDGDPSVGIVLVPIGGGLLFVAVLLTARGISHMKVEQSSV